MRFKSNRTGLDPTPFSRCGECMARERVDTGTPFEQVAGFSRAIKVGRTVHVAGTTASDQDGRVLAKGDASQQTRIALQCIQRVLLELGSSLEDVVRTRMFLVNENDCYRVMRAHGEAFKEIRPVTTLVVVKALVDPEMLIEIEVEAIIPRKRPVKE